MMDCGVITGVQKKLKFLHHQLLLVSRLNVRCLDSLRMSLNNRTKA